MWRLERASGVPGDGIEDYAANPQRTNLKNHQLSSREKTLPFTINIKQESDQSLILMLFSFIIECAKLFTLSSMNQSEKNHQLSFGKKTFPFNYQYKVRKVSSHNIT